MTAFPFSLVSLSPIRDTEVSLTTVPLLPDQWITTHDIRRAFGYFQPSGRAGEGEPRIFAWMSLLLRAAGVFFRRRASARAFMNTLGARRDCRLILRLNVRYRRECVQPATSGTEQERRRASHRELQSTEAPPLTPSFAIIGWFFPGGLSIEAATRNDSPKRAEPTNSGCTRAEPTCRIARDKPRRRGLFRGTLERGKKISARIVQAGRCAGLFPRDRMFSLSILVSNSA